MRSEGDEETSEEEKEERDEDGLNFDEIQFNNEPWDRETNPFLQSRSRMAEGTIRWADLLGTAQLRSWFPRYIQKHLR